MPFVGLNRVDRGRNVKEERNGGFERNGCEKFQRAAECSEAGIQGVSSILLGIISLGRD